MSKTAIIISIIAILISGYALTQKADYLGSQMMQPYSYFGATNSSSSIASTATTTNPILSLDANRNNAIVCNNSVSSTIYLHQMSQSTTTGVTINTGIPLYATTTQGQTCQDFPGFKGYLIGICNGNNCWATVSSWR